MLKHLIDVFGERFWARVRKEARRAVKGVVQEEMIQYRREQEAAREKLRDEFLLYRMEEPPSLESIQGRVEGLLKKLESTAGPRTPSEAAFAHQILKAPPEEPTTALKILMAAEGVSRVTQEISSGPPSSDVPREEAGKGLTDEQEDDLESARRALGHVLASGVGCTCFRDSPCSFCTSMTGTVADAWCTGGIDGLRDLIEDLEGLRQ